MSFEVLACRCAADDVDDLFGIDGRLIAAPGDMTIGADETISLFVYRRCVLIVDGFKAQGDASPTRRINKARAILCFAAE